jgi:predicted Zn-dependent protease
MIAVLAGVVAFVVLAAGAGGWWVASRPARLLARAEAASKAGDHAGALAAWRAVNASGRARSSTLISEARAALALGRAAEADRALARAAAADPSNPEPWRLRLERFRVEDEALEAREVGWAAYAAVPSTARREVLRDLTLALLADLPEDLVRQTLARWASANPSAPDRDARVALLRRIASMPRSGDPDRGARIAELAALLAADPRHVAAREALAADLADAGEPDRGRAVLDAWPEPLRDARYWRLRGRWDLDYDRHPARAVEAFTRALTDLPHDWKTRVRLARALHALGRETASKQEADAVARTREALDPSTLGPRLSADLARLDAPSALLDLSDLCARAGLTRLADAWRREAVAAR